MSVDRVSSLVQALEALHWVPGVPAELGVREAVERLTVHEDGRPVVPGLVEPVPGGAGGSLAGFSSVAEFQAARDRVRLVERVFGSLNVYFRDWCRNDAAHLVEVVTDPSFFDVAVRFGVFGVPVCSSAGDLPPEPKAKAKGARS